MPRRHQVREAWEGEAVKIHLWVGMGFATKCGTGYRSNSVTASRMSDVTCNNCRRCLARRAKRKEK